MSLLVFCDTSIKSDASLLGTMLGIPPLSLQFNRCQSLHVHSANAVRCSVLSFRKKHLICALLVWGYKCVWLLNVGDVRSELTCLCLQPMSLQELWQWVHYSYGEDLELSDGDDDYISLTSDEKIEFQTHVQQKLIEQSTDGLSSTGVRIYLAYWYYCLCLGLEVM